MQTLNLLPRFHSFGDFTLYGPKNNIFVVVNEDWENGDSPNKW